MFSLKSSLCKTILVTILVAQTPCVSVVHAAQQQAATPSLVPALSIKQSADKNQKPEEQHATASSQAWSIVKYTGACVAIVYAASALVALAIYARIKDLLPTQGHAHSNDDDDEG